MRILKGEGFDQVINIAGGFISILRFAKAVGFKHITLDAEAETLKSEMGKTSVQTHHQNKENQNTSPNSIVIDVRTVKEFQSGAYPGAVNIPLDELEHRITELGTDFNRDITVYCASGARSAYAQNVLKQKGFTQVKMQADYLL